MFLPGSFWDVDETWVESRRLEADYTFLVACRGAAYKKVKEWGMKVCESFEQYKVENGPGGWYFFLGGEPQESHPEYPQLSVSNITTTRLVGGLKVRSEKGKKYLAGYPPSVRVEGITSGEIVRKDLLNH